MTSPRVPPRDPAMPPIPQDDDGPVFREPWEAQAFALVLELYAKRRSPGPEWVRRLSAEIAAAKPRGEPDQGTAIIVTGWRRSRSGRRQGPDHGRGLATRRGGMGRGRPHRGFGEPMELGARPWIANTTAKGARREEEQ